MRARVFTSAGPHRKWTRFEQATGSTYAAELDRFILRPLGLAGTYLLGDETAICGSRARMYSTLFLPDAEVHDVTEVDPSWGWAAGGIVSTTGDWNNPVGTFITLLEAEFDRA